MAVAFAWFLAVLHAVAAPLGRRFRAAALWAGRALGAEGNDEPIDELARRGWHGLLHADLWVLPVLGAIILLFQHPWQVVPLLLVAFGGAALLDRLPIWPSAVDWYLARLRGQLEGRVRRASAAAGDVEPGRPARVLDDLVEMEERYRDRGISLPTPAEAARTPRGDVGWLLRDRSGS